MHTILIANRGEIACRIIATAQRMGLRTVAVYSDADRFAPHVQVADTAVCIGPASATESYLRSDAILAAARATGATLIHPGYGFLSENAEFAEAVTQAGLIFVGPTASAIRAMGLKDAAKARMEAAGVPVVPGHHGSDLSLDTLAAAADQIGYPVLLKARAGGGGKGMRRVDAPAEFAAALEGARREGLASFGDEAVLVEKYIETPRHIEVQVLADAHGTVLHLFERDCSLQRRHQKVIEEAPAPDMPVAVRQAMGAAAVEAARAIGYAGAGTVEFIADGSAGLREDGFWFMEMNTRLQVEHPVTEAVTGLDLVEWQIRVALGEALPFTQVDLSLRGHAFEARIYAEDPAAGFLPAPGTVTHLHWPSAARFATGALRVDSGIAEGDTITAHYDPMIAKLIAYGSDRASALAQLQKGLAEVRIAGPVTNVPFLSALLADDDVQAGRVDTGLIARRGAALLAMAPAGPVLLGVAALAAAGLGEPLETGDPGAMLRGFRAWGPARTFADLEYLGDRLSAMITIERDGAYTIEIGGEEVTLCVHPLADTAVRVTHAGLTRTVHIHRDGRRLTVFEGNTPHVFDLSDPLGAGDAADYAGDVVEAPMPGLVRDVRVTPGDVVAKGDPLVVMEAMKMEHTLCAPRDGVVAAVLLAAGANAGQGAVLVTLEQVDV
ncbi:acetyl/propionyl/methylcrotonyl-CoA carboxylase subunit alpha [Meridianimarinicoccus aquatilis]|uniref:ATP-grasp domain-containing protein n=1 Tax=Meridianimarinicoccus aquatilis TaxID=2552766 RepID=A0A4R6AVR7_9RHOB|nr:biotin carboxylase N-terminal domain-containing protein [Fluviibacterium aquatile]TDL87765.1 ATP-grasp domain-containing protein [Fluviibacterium aquatile]